MKVKVGQVYLRWLQGGPVTPFIVREVGETGITISQMGIENDQAMDHSALEMYLKSGDVKLVYDDEPVGEVAPMEAIDENRVVEALDSVTAEIEEDSFEPDPEFYCPISSNADFRVCRNKHGRGLYANRPFYKDQILEECPVVVLERDGAQCGVIERYRWRWKENQCLAFGYCGSMINHSKHPNVVSDYNYERGTITFRASEDIQRGEQLFICYSAFYPPGKGLPEVAAKLGELNTLVDAAMLRKEREKCQTRGVEYPGGRGHAEKGERKVSVNQERQKEFCRDLAQVLRRHGVWLDVSGTYAEGLTVELDCGGEWFSFPDRREIITPELLERMSDA